MKNFILAIALLALTSQALAAPDPSPVLKLINCPTADNPKAHTFDWEARLFPDGGFLSGLHIGLVPKLSVGIYYGGTGIISYEEPVWNQEPGVMVQYRLIDETETRPAFALGFTNQGYGSWDEEKERYMYKAKGFFLAIGKYYTLGRGGDIGFHLGFNQNPISDEDTRPDFYFGFDYHPLHNIAIMSEYTPAINDQGREYSFTHGRGNWNAGIRWIVERRLALDFVMLDLINNLRGDYRIGKQMGREIRISYIENF